MNTQKLESPKIPLPMHFNSGAEVNVIDQSFAIANDLEPVDAPLPSPKWMDGNKTFCYAAYLISYKLQDNWGYTKQCQHVFYAIAKEDDPLLVVGMPALTEEHIKIDIAICTWQFGVVANAFKVLPPQEFALLVADINVNKGQRVYALRTNASHAKANVNTTSKLPKELKEYKDVFSTEEAGRLPSHKGRNHAIQTTAEPPFGPLYNLSNIELAELIRYLDDALAKG